MESHGATEPAELEAMVGDLRRVVARLEQSGPDAVDADLALVPGEPAALLRRALAQSAHLLGPLEPPPALAATLVSRLEPVAALESIVRPYVTGFQEPWLRPVWPLPDLPDPALRRVLRGPDATAMALAASPDGSWLAA